MKDSEAEEDFQRLLLEKANLEGQIKSLKWALLIITEKTGDE